MKKIYLVEESSKAHGDTYEHFFRTEAEALQAAADFWDNHKKNRVDRKNLTFTVYEIEPGCYPDKSEIATFKEA